MRLQSIRRRFAGSYLAGLLALRHLARDERIPLAMAAETARTWQVDEDDLRLAIEAQRTE